MTDEFVSIKGYLGRQFRVMRILVISKDRTTKAKSKMGTYLMLKAYDSNETASSVKFNRNQINKSKPVLTSERLNFQKGSVIVGINYSVSGNGTDSFIALLFGLLNNKSAIFVVVWRQICLKVNKNEAKGMRP